MRQSQDSGVMALMEHVIATGTDEMRDVFGKLLNLAMQLEREQFLGAGPYSLPLCFLLWTSN